MLNRHFSPLLREYTRKGIVGSNPIFSAIFSIKSTKLFGIMMRAQKRRLQICAHSYVNSTGTCGTSRGKSGGLGSPHVLHQQILRPVDNSDRRLVHRTGEHFVYRRLRE